MKSPIPVKIDDSNHILAQAESLLAIARESKDEKAYVIPLLITAAIALESLLNDSIVTSCYKEFPKSDYRSLAESFLSMSLKGKLNSVIPLASKNEYLFDKESSDYQTLKNLISLRNEIAHTKSFFEEVEFDEVTEEFEGKQRDGISFDVDWLAKRFTKAIYSASLNDAEVSIKSIGKLKSVLLNYGEQEFNYDHEFIKPAKA